MTLIHKNLIYTIPLLITKMLPCVLMTLVFRTTNPLRAHHDNNASPLTFIQPTPCLARTPFQTSSFPPEPTQALKSPKINKTSLAQTLLTTLSHKRYLLMCVLMCFNLATQHGSLKKFQNDHISAYLERAALYFKANEFTDKKKQLAVAQLGLAQIMLI